MAYCSANCSRHSLCINGRLKELKLQPLENWKHSKYRVLQGQLFSSFVNYFIYFLWVFSADARQDGWHVLHSECLSVVFVQRSTQCGQGPSQLKGQLIYYFTFLANVSTFCDSSKLLKNNYDFFLRNMKWLNSLYFRIALELFCTLLKKLRRWLWTPSRSLVSYTQSWNILFCSTSFHNSKISLWDYTVHNLL